MIKTAQEQIEKTWEGSLKSSFQTSSVCPICESSDTQLVQKHVKGNLPSYKTLRGAESGPELLPIRVYRCAPCVLDFLETWGDVEAAYKPYQNNDYVLKKNVVEGFCKFDELQNRFNAVRPYLTAQTRLLDVGCGEGLFLKKVAPYVASAEGTEITEHYVQVLRSRGLNIWDCLLHEMKPKEPYDVVCLYALLEHIPRVGDFLEDLKKLLHPKSQIFFELPNLRDPLAYYYDIENYRNFFYRRYHLYYFTETSLRKLLEKAGFECEVRPLLAASLSNHFHWLHQKKGQATTNDMVNMTLPAPLLKVEMPNGESFRKLLDDVDDFYRQKLLQAGIGDLLSCRAWLR